MSLLIAFVIAGVVLFMVGWVIYLLVVFGISVVWVALHLLLAGVVGVSMISTVIAVGVAMICYDLFQLPLLSIGIGIIAFLICAYFGGSILYQELLRATNKLQKLIQ